jgi:GAF domain-containing protein
MSEEQQEAVARLAQFALTAPQPAAVLNHACRAVTRALAVDAVAVLQRDPGSHRLRLVAAIGRPAAAIGTYTADDSESLAGYTLRSGPPVIVDDLAAEARFQCGPLLGDCGLRSGTCAPLIGAGGFSHGVIGAFAGAVGRFDQSDAAFLQDMATVVAGFLDRTRDRLEGVAESAAPVTTLVIDIDHLKQGRFWSSALPERGRVLTALTNGSSGS